jgi:type I restriction enzyme R subunit
MLDTGIDVPEVANLVFFKPVRSSAKFWQMIGRGTRLCKDLFGYGLDKKEFIIFDFCENFEFFNNKPKGIEGTSSKSLSQRLFELRLRLSFVLQHQEDTKLKVYGTEVLEGLILQTQSLNTDSFIVRQNWRIVEKYRDPNAWNALTDLDIKELFDHIAPLITETDQDEMAKRFDAIMLDIQLSILNDEKKQAGLIQKVISTAGRLSKKASIPSVARKMEEIKEAQSKVFWLVGDILAIERLRLDLRELMKFIDFESTAIYFTMFEDEFDGMVMEHQLVYGFNDLEAYKRKVEQYVKQQSSHLTIHKIRNNIQITKDELTELEVLLFEQGEFGSREKFLKAFGDQPFGKFIRSIVGLDANAAKLAFGEILSGQTLNSQQIRFMDTIINFLTVKGLIEPSMLFESPFSDINTIGVFDDAISRKIISLIASINDTAEVA